MHADLANLGWTDEQWNRITSTVTEEAQRARVAAQVLPTCGPEDPSVVAVPKYALSAVAAAPGAFATQRLEVDSAPDLPLTTIAVNVELRTADVGDTDLRAALVMFRRAANIISRIEDALVFNGRAATDIAPLGITGTSTVSTVHGKGAVQGLLIPPKAPPPAPPPPAPAPGAPNVSTVGAPPDLVKAIVNAISSLERRGQAGPFACVLGDTLFEVACTPLPASLVLPRDRILPFLQGPLLRSSTIDPTASAGVKGVVIALGGEPIEIVVASDISVRYMQATLEPRYVFRVSEKVALRIKDDDAIQLLK